MAMFISRNLDWMRREGVDINSLPIKCGEPEVTERSFQEIVGRKRKELYEDEILRAVLRETDELDFPFDFLLSAEFGAKICLIGELPKDKESDLRYSYLMDTHHDVIMMDYHEVIKIVRQEFLKEVQVYDKMFQLVEGLVPVRGAKLLTLD